MAYNSISNNQNNPLAEQASDLLSQDDSRDSLFHLEEYIHLHFNQERESTETPSTSQLFTDISPPHTSENVSNTERQTSDLALMTSTSLEIKQEVDPTVDDELLALAKQIDSQTSGFGGGGSFSQGSQDNSSAPLSWSTVIQQSPLFTYSDSTPENGGLPILNYDDVVDLTYPSEQISIAPQAPTEMSVFSSTHHLKYLASSIVKNTTGTDNSPGIKSTNKPGALLANLPIRQLHSPEPSPDNAHPTLDLSTITKPSSSKLTSKPTNSRNEGPRMTMLMDALLQRDPEKEHKQQEGEEDLGQGMSSGKKKGAFHIDKTKLQAVPMSSQSSELTGLGLTVYNQEELEQGMYVLSTTTAYQMLEDVIWLRIRMCCHVHVFTFN